MREGDGYSVFRWNDINLLLVYPRDGVVVADEIRLLIGGLLFLGYLVSRVSLVSSVLNHHIRSNSRLSY